MTKILHLSDTTLSGSPIRICNLINSQSVHQARHIVWKRRVFERVFPVDMVGEEMTNEELYYWVHEWADVLHFHNRWKRQEIIKKVGLPKRKKGVIQIHSPRFEEGHQEEVDSGLPLAIIAQYHVREWPELRYIVPNVVDINQVKPVFKPSRNIPLVCYAPSSPNGRGWNNKSYNTVHPILKKLQMIEGKILYDRVISKPFDECMAHKMVADIGIDEVSTGSYHLSSLEYLAMGVCTIGKIDPLCEKVIKDLTGCKTLPWYQSSEETFSTDFNRLVASHEYKKHGDLARAWMEKFWTARFLCDKYINMYKDL